jgi:hypothetical protein
VRFNKGTIRMLFVTEPNRLKVLAGKILALTTSIAAAIAATLAISIGAGALMANTVGVETAAWWTADGVAAIGAAAINLTAADRTADQGRLWPGLSGLRLGSKVVRTRSLPRWGPSVLLPVTRAEGAGMALPRTTAILGRRRPRAQQRPQWWLSVAGLLVATPAVATTPADRTARPGIAAAGRAVLWRSCGDGFECATVRVPLDYDRPQGRRIDLALIRLPATNSAARIGLLFVNPGDLAIPVCNSSASRGGASTHPRCGHVSTS